MPVYNAGRYLDDALASLEAQSAQTRHWDVHLVDDGSTDNSQEIMKKWARRMPNLHILFNQMNRGQCYTRNRAIGFSQGEFLGLLDADDRLKPFAIEAVLDFLSERPSAHYLYSSHDRIDPEGEIFETKLALPFDYDALFHYNLVSPFKVFSRAIHNGISGYRLEYPLAQDWDHALRAAIKLEGQGFFHQDSALYEYRVHPESISCTPRRIEARKEMICRFLSEAVRERFGLEATVFWQGQKVLSGNNYNYFDWRGADSNE